MRAIWTGAIGFGLVNIPVKIYSAIQSSSLDLDMLDKKDFANIKFHRVNANTGKQVAWENIVKGYKVDDKYVVLTEADFEKASPEKNKMIEIEEFVEESAINSMYYDTPYYLQAEKSGTKAYALLRDALAQTGKVALGTFVLRNRENLVLIKAIDDMLVLEKIRFAQEIRDPEEIKAPATKSKPAEVKMAIALIDQLSQEFDIKRYKDTYTDKLMSLIKAKSKGKTVKTSPLKVVHSRSRDLMSQLQASLKPKTARKKAS